MADVIGFDPAAWSIDGARIDSELMRVLAYAGTGGAEGVITAGDCRVRPLDVPGAGVQIDVGGLLIRNRSGSTKNQTYAANGRSQTRLDTVDTTSSGPRSDLVVVRIEDPEYAPWPAPDASEAPDYQYVRPLIIPGVPPTTRSLDDLGLAVPYSGYALARIDRPASVGTVTDAHLVDLREVARPRRSQFMDRYDITYQPNESGTQYNTWIKYPDLPQALIPCPSFAAKAVVRVNLTGPQLIHNPIAGYFRWKMTPTTGGGPSVYSKNTYVNEQTYGAGERKSYLIGSTIDIPASLRGRMLTCNLEWYKNGGEGYFRSELDVQVVVDIDFVEAAS